eukprot:gene1399-1768_t
MLGKIDNVWITYAIRNWSFKKIPDVKEYSQFYKEKYLDDKKRIGFKPEKYIISIQESCSEFTDASRWVTERIIAPNSWWKKRFLEEMSCLTMTKLEINRECLPIRDSTNQIITGTIVDLKTNLPIGLFRFIETSDALLKFKGQNWTDATIESPYTGPTLGYFNFSLLPLDYKTDEFEPYRSTITEFLKTLTFHTRGMMTRIETGYYSPSIVFEQCSLSTVFGRYGMNDGDCLLDTDMQSNYIVSLIEHIQKFLDSKGVGYNSVQGGAKVNFTEQTSHNPIRCSGHLPKEANSWEIGIWIYNSIIINNKKLWNRRLENNN